ncbi:sugar phosphate isomerase/epimerase family protein [Alkalicoccobacillus plakortidis]|uniref:Sugar phosphate isomerase/epimerase n=1 Tax=Alkalicoccobacillus plakortidis TaxID=444060 RepID=A0ABT0XMD7_9BACI|nr:sugar phosphate isomerase/epimerase [Alkalicoccobacillus plakortidis]MCM2677072.1 sugar phosphate isomerase/epimerase [Alkalicoccobacillus plakortidis]
MAKLPIALQLFTLRNETKEDFLGTLKKVKELGYDGVEFAGFGGYEASELKSFLNDLDLKPFSSHVGLELLEDNAEEIIAYHKELGVETIVIPYLVPERRTAKEDYLKLAESLNLYGEKVKEAGMQLCYHNHDFEFEKYDGEYALDLIFSNTNPEFVQVELDTYWAEFAGISAVDYAAKYKGRLPLAHIKDLVTSPEKTFAEVGEGVLDIKAIAAAVEEAGAKRFIVEQDVCQRPALESVEISIRNFKEILGR